MNTMRNLAATAAVCALAWGAVTACGSSSDGDSDAAKAADSPIRTMPEDEFVDAGNALCESNGQAVASGFEALSQPPRPAELQAAFDNMVKESYKVTGDMLVLGAPEGRGDEWYDTALRAHQVTVEVEKAGSEAFFADESDPWADVTETIVNDFGLTSCQPSE